MHSVFLQFQFCGCALFETSMSSAHFSCPEFNVTSPLGPRNRRNYTPYARQTCK